MNDLKRNAMLHRRINDAIKVGTINVVDVADEPGAINLTQRLVSNRQAGRPLLEGMTVFRGAKDPDVDAGTFYQGFKHATPLANLARGYAALANQKIGLVVKAAQGIGVLAEYALPSNARFVGNFGLEDDVHAERSMSVDQVSERLLPLVNAYVSATSGEAQDQAQSALNVFYRAHLYELAVPSEQPPLRCWVVQLDEDTGIDRLLVHQEEGALADVLIDVVRERKLGVDAHGPASTIAELRRGGSAGLDRLDTFVPGTATALTQVADRLDTMLNNLREQAYAAPLNTLHEALLWRRDAQKGMNLSRLTNSGMDLVFEHNHPGLQAVPGVQSLLDTLNHATQLSEKRHQQQSVLDQVRQFQTLSTQCKVEKDLLGAERRLLSTAQTLLIDEQKQYARQSESLEQDTQTHRAKRSANFIARLRYQWGSEPQALKNLDSQRRSLDVQERTIQDHNATVSEQRVKVSHHEGQAMGLSEQIRANEQVLRERRQNGDLEFLPIAVVNRLNEKKPLDANEWHDLTQAAHRAVRSTDRTIAEGHRAAHRMVTLANEGLEPLASTRKIPPISLPLPLPPRADMATKLEAMVAQAQHQRVEPVLRTSPASAMTMG